MVIGGDAAGMSAASQALRRAEPGALRVIAFERTGYTSYSACGIPYWLGGELGSDTGPEVLVVRSPERHRRNGIDVRTRTEVVALDLERQEVLARPEDGEEYREGFDELVVATGAVPIRPELPGIDLPGIHGVQTLQDGTAVLDSLSNAPEHAVVVGGGYIGLEMAEALLARGLYVTVVEQASQPMSTLDPDMGALVGKAMVHAGIDLRTSTTVVGFGAGPAGRVGVVRTDTADLPAELVVLGIGVRPNCELARAAGMPLGETGGVRTDRRMRVLGHDNVWAAGDCVEVTNRVSGAAAHVALGTHANKQGRVIGTNLTGGYATFPGVVGTAMSRMGDLEVARTGLSESEARLAGFAFRTVTVESSTRAGYLPGAAPMTVKLIVELGRGRLLGAQIVGGQGAAKRVDVCATALCAGMTVEDMVGLDLGYAPPFSPVWDPVLLAARKAAEQGPAEQGPAEQG